MGAPEELRQAVRVVLADHFPMTPLYRVDRAADAVLAVPAIAGALAHATRLRSLAATFDSHLNRGKTYTGAQVAAMLRDGGE